MALTLLKSSARRERKENQLWLIVLCDLMTNLMLFFLIMYAFTQEPAEAKRQFLKGLENAMKLPGENKPEVKIKKIEAVIDDKAADALKKALKSKGLADVAKVVTAKEKISILLPARILFPSGRANLTDNARSDLAPVGMALSGISSQIVVQGHTDNVPTSAGPYKTNWELSLARAQSVLEFLISDCNVPENCLVLAGYGEFRPVASNETAAGRAQNRRIEIIITRKTQANHGTTP